MIPLSQLKPRLIRYDVRREETEMLPPEYRGADQSERWHADGEPTIRELVDRTDHIPAATVAEAQGIIFLCPKCFTENGGARGTHTVMVTFSGRGVPDDVGSRGTAGPTRWTATGDSIERLSTTPSILLPPPCCGWHGYLTDGHATSC